MKNKILSLCLMAIIAIPAAKASQFSDVYSPQIPKTVSICGNNVSLSDNIRYERFDRELTGLIYSHTNTLLLLKRAPKYKATIERILKQQGVPTDLFYLACVESVLDPRAYSSAGAAGLWQFLDKTGRQYGLEVNDEVDQRYDTELATRAACKYFKEALSKYGDWPSVMASYNGGMRRISNAMSDQKQSKALDLYLNEQSTRYMYRIMATKLIMENPEQFGYHVTEDQLYRPYDVEIVEVSGPVSDWPTWAKERGLTYAQLKEANPWIRSYKLTNTAKKTYKVRVPKKDSLNR